MTDTVLTADDPSVKDATTTAVYGIYLPGQSDPVLKPDSFISYSYMNDSRLSTYPQEAGSFQTYNKVENPYDVRIQMTKGGTVTEVAAFLAAAEKLIKTKDLNLYDVITPERTYASANVYKISHDHKRDHGANMATVDLYLNEIRVTASASYTNTKSPTTTGNLAASKSPTATDAKQGGIVQPQTPTPAQAAPVQTGLTEILGGASGIVP